VITLFFIFIRRPIRRTPGTEASGLLAEVLFNRGPTVYAIMRCLILKSHILRFLPFEHYKIILVYDFHQEVHI
jgi:hypothetical protein